MKKIAISRRHLNRRGSQKGIALITTLIILTLVVLVVVIFFMSVQAALRSSRLTQDSAELKNLRDSAISLALAQIREGTTQGEIWTSQPGAIRTFSLGDGSPQKIFKLYSDEEMNMDVTTGTNAAELSLAGDVPTDWDEQGGGEAYVDLNEPVLSGGELFFPIVDPRLNDGSTPAAGSQTPEGFSYQQQHPVGGSGNIAGIYTPTPGGGSPEDQRVPMPVKWIYTLRDGSLGTLNDSGTFVPFNGENAASADNPISGRFAFWTDDESCKINVNTASEAMPWDTPRCVTPEDVEYARYPPVRHEVQRFGGHPASTCLSSVFFPHQHEGNGLDPQNNADKFQFIYDLVPYVNYRDNNESPTGYLGNRQPNPVEFDEDRLYANIEEALLKPDRSENEIFRLFGPQKLSRSRFLLTANSRAPELTASGKPRICLWPVRNDSVVNGRTLFDKRIAFSSSVNGRRYYFLRNSPRTTVSEYISNNQLLEYLYGLTAATDQGYSMSMRTKYGNQNMATGCIGFAQYMRITNLHDTTEIAPNMPVNAYADYGGEYYGTRIYAQVPAVGIGALASSIRGSLGTSSPPPANVPVSTNGIGRIYVTSEIGLVFSLRAENLPGTANDYPDDATVTALGLPEGFKAIQVAVMVEAFCPAQGYTMTAPGSNNMVMELGKLRMKTGPSPGVDAPIVGGGGWGNIMHSIPHLSDASATETGYANTGWWVGWGGSGGRYLHLGDGIPADINKREQYLNGFFQVPSGETTVTLTVDDADADGVLTEEERRLWFTMSDQRSDTTIDGGESRRTHFLVPENMEIPVPERPVVRQPSWQDRYTEARVNNYENPETIDPNDVVRTWVSRHGDHRLQYVRQSENDDISVLPTINYLFVPHPGWDPADGGNTTDKQVHSFTLPGGKPDKVGEDGSGVGQDATFQRGIVAGSDFDPTGYAWDVQPDFTIDPDYQPANPPDPLKPKPFSAHLPLTYPYSVDPNETRDFDNGTGIAPDGAYWNKDDDVAQKEDGSLPPYFAKYVWDGFGQGALNQTPAPNQKIPSAIMYGSINSAAYTGAPWTTYLFRPDITPGGHLGSAGHSLTSNAAAGAPPDHTILDWFWMPVVQPYAISEKYSTAGKINMNYRIAPFTYITRATGLHAVLKSERMLAIPTTAGQTYKVYSRDNLRGPNIGWRHRIDAEKTLEQFEYKFNQGEVFRLASEICEQFLVPEGESPGAMPTSFRNDMIAFWDDHRLTGDNTLERPYANLYPRLTTRSNVFRVHLIAQTLIKPANSNPATFGPGDGTVTGEYRGEALMERAIDPNDDDVPQEGDLNPYYAYRILYQRRFAP